jgi:hypothetical protein
MEAAKALGAEVTAATRLDKLDLIRSLGTPKRICWQPRRVRSDRREGKDRLGIGPGLPYTYG